MARFLPGWYQLSQEQQNSILAKHHEALEKVGAKQTLLCNTYWCTDQWLFAGVEEFPQHRGSPEVHGNPSGVKLAQIR